ncbi:MAG TPA: large conductance mechanosensitive channel protein MscL [Galbitalea sp.]
MIKGFKEFILRGNVIDLAVAFVIGAAFTAVVTAFVINVINPLIGAIFSASNLSKTLIVSIPSATDPSHPAKLLFGAFIGAAINFVIIAAVVYFALVLPVKVLTERAAARKAAGQEPVVEAPEITEVDLLTDIRDLLAKTAVEPAAGKHTGDPTV